MPNWCYNAIEFTGNQKKLETLEKLLKKTVDIQNATDLGQLLHGLDGYIDGYMFNISAIDIGEGYLFYQFESRWNPIPNDIVRIAELFGLNFTYSYEESGMELYGKYTFKIEDGTSYLYRQQAHDDDIEYCKTYDEEENISDIDIEALELLIESKHMISVPIVRITVKIEEL